MGFNSGFKGLTFSLIYFHTNPSTGCRLETRGKKDLASALLISLR